MKTFVVLGIYEYSADQSTNILYAGNDEEKAMSFNPDTFYHTLKLEVWAKDMVIQAYSKVNIYDWVLEFDKIKTVRDEIEVKKSEMKKAQKELDDLTSLLEID